MEPDASRKKAHIYCSTFFQAAGDCCTRNQAVLVLCATLLGISEAMTSTLGSLGFFGFLLIPFGFVLARYWGASKSLGWERYTQAISALVIGLLVLFCPAIARAPFLLLVIVMYLSVSISGSMTFPLQKALTTRQTLPGYLACSSYISHGTYLLVSLAVTWYMKSHNDLRAIGLLIIFGGILHFFAGTAFYTMGDITEIREDAKKFVIGNIREAIKDKAIMGLLISGTIMDLFLCMVPQMCYIAVQNGVGCTPDELMIFNTINVCASIAATFFYKYISQHFGSRTCMLWTTPLIVVLSLFWWLVPANAPWFWFIFPFVLIGALNIFISTSQANYFTATAPPHLVVPGTILIFLTNGALAGVLGMIFNPLLHNIIWNIHVSSPMTHYRIFLSMGVLIFLIGFPAILLLPKDNPSNTDKALSK